jgi:hypothetical protein
MNSQFEEIRRKAYELWERRGRPLGSPEVDWLQAVRLLYGEEAAQEFADSPEAMARLRYGLREIDGVGSR